MIKTVRLHLNSPDGNRRYINHGLIVCENCRQILGYLNGDGFNEIRMLLYCRCGNIGLIKETADPPSSVLPKPLKDYKNEYRCETCSAPLFSLNKSHLNNFAFNVVCKCGASYTKDIASVEGRGCTPELIKNFKKRMKSGNF